MCPDRMKLFEMNADPIPFADFRFTAEETAVKALDTGFCHDINF